MKSIAVHASSGRRVYVSGTRPDVSVPMREVALTEPNPPVRLYDTSGPHGEAGREVALDCGIEPLRRPWIEGRGDVVELDGPSSAYRRQREADPRTAAIRFPAPRRPLVAKPGRRVTQMHYARRGEVTPEMDFVAVREGVDAELVRREVALGRATPSSFVARSP